MAKVLWSKISILVKVLAFLEKCQEGGALKVCGGPTLRWLEVRPKTSPLSLQSSLIQFQTQIFNPFWSSGLISYQEDFFSMKFFTWSDFNNARKSFKKILIFELNSLFLVQLTFAFLHPFIDNSRVSVAEIKNIEKNYFI